MGNSVRTTMQKIVYYFGGSARRRTRETHPADGIVGAGRVGRNSGVCFFKIVLQAETHTKVPKLGSWFSWNQSASEQIPEFTASKMLCEHHLEGRLNDPDKASIKFDDLEQASVAGLYSVTDGLLCWNSNLSLTDKYSTHFHVFLHLKHMFGILTQNNRHKHARYCARFA